MNMRRLLLTIMLLCPLVLMAQVEQKGFVRLKSDKAGSKAVPLSGVAVSAHKANTVRSDAQGGFVLVFSQKHYADSVTITSITKSGYELLSDHLLRKGAWNLSRQNPIEVVMVKTIDRIREQNAIERRLREKLKADFEENIQTLESQLEQQSITLESYQQKYDDLVKKYENSQWVSKEAERLAKTDYAELDSMQAVMTDLRKQGIGNQMVDIAKQNISQTVLSELEKNPQMIAQRIAKQEEQLRKEQNYSKFLAEQLLNIADGFRMQSKLDSAEYYYKLRSNLDSRNFDYYMDYANFLLQQHRYDTLKALLQTDSRFTNLSSSQQAAVHYLKGQMFYAFGTYNDAENQYRQCIQLCSDDNTEEALFRKALSHSQLGYTQMTQGRGDEAEQSFFEAIKIYENLNTASDNKYATEISMVMRFLADLYVRQYRFTDAEKELKKSLEWCKLITSPEQSQHEQAMKLLGLGFMYHGSNNYEAALENYRSSAAMLHVLMSQNPDAYTIDYTVALDGMAQVLDLKLQVDSAEQFYKTVLDIRQSLADASPAIYEGYLAESCSNYAGFLQEQKRYPEAEQMYLKALKIKRHLSERQPEAFEYSLALTINNLGGLYLWSGDMQKSDKTYVEAIAIVRRLSASNPQMYSVPLARMLTNVAKLHDDMGNLKLAEEEYNEAISIYDAFGKTDNSLIPYKALAMNNLAKVHEANRRYSKAEKLYKNSLELFIEAEKSSEGVFKYYISVLYMNLSNLYTLQNKWQPAVDNLIKARDILTELVANSPQSYTEDLVDVLQKLLKLADNVSDEKLKADTQHQLDGLKK